MRPRIFGQDADILASRAGKQPVQYGRDAAHISWAAWVQTSLEDCMEERQHHLNESPSARLGRSQKLEILPSPNSKSLGAYILHRRRDFNVRLVTVVYYGAHIVFSICADILDMRRYFGYAQIFQDVRIYLDYEHIFCV